VQTFLINMAWDGAGCAYKQADAINTHTDWTARHFRAVKTFYEELDIGPENYNKEEFLSIIENSDILHFCAATHSYDSPHDFGFDWKDVIKDKILIFHDYNSFPGRWNERVREKDHWNKREEIGYDAIFSSIPQATLIYKDCVYIPDTVNELAERYTPSNINRREIVLGHFPTGDSNNKNTHELNQAIYTLANTHKIMFHTEIRRELSHNDLMKIKKRCTLGFDALWRGFHGMTTVENLALGIPTLTSIDGNFEEVFKEFHQTDTFPFEIVFTVEDVVNCLKEYAEYPERIEERSNIARKFMVDKWSYKNIANRIVEEYEKLGG